MLLKMRLILRCFYQTVQINVFCGCYSRLRNSYVLWRKNVVCWNKDRRWRKMTKSANVANRKSFSTRRMPAPNCHSRLANHESTASLALDHAHQCGCSTGALYYPPRMVSPTFSGILSFVCGVSFPSKNPFAGGSKLVSGALPP